MMQKMIMIRKNASVKKKTFFDGTLTMEENSSSILISTLYRNGFIALGPNRSKNFQRKDHLSRNNLKAKENISTLKKQNKHA